MKNITKKILSAALSCALLISFCACTGDGDSTQALADTAVTDAETDAVTDAETLPPEETDGVVSVLAAAITSCTMRF